MEMCKYEVCILVLSPEHQMLIMQTGFCTFPPSGFVHFCLAAPLFLEPNYQKMAVFSHYKESCFVQMNSRTGVQGE